MAIYCSIDNAIIKPNVYATKIETMKPPDII